MKIGVLGAGQLGRMLALAGIPLGFEFRFFSPANDPVVDKLGEVVRASFEDEKALTKFSDGLDVVTYEFENVPASATMFLSKRVPVFPSLEALRVSQNRVLEKILLRDLGIPTTLFCGIKPTTKEEYLIGIEKVGFPCVVKTASMGYDGKGQWVLRCKEDVENVYEQVLGEDLIVEKLVTFSREISQIAARNREGDTRFYPLVCNEHQRGILHTSSPITGVDELSTKAKKIMEKVLVSLSYVGVCTLEFFEENGELLVNEIAPRVHNSGHWTIEGSNTSQFENHLRAITGWPLGSCAPRGYSYMCNLIGHKPDFKKLLSIEGVHVHWYGKEIRPGRKLGHVTICTETKEKLGKLVDLVKPLCLH